MQRTFGNLENWTKRVFEKFGWMILAIHDKNSDQVNQYLLCINSLIMKIDNKIKITEDIDRKNDLLLLKQQVEYLQIFANNTLTNVNNF